MASFLRLILPSIEIRNENEGLQRKRRFSAKTRLKPKFRKRRLCVLVWTENILKTKLFESDNHVISLKEVFSNTNPKELMIVSCSNFSVV